MLQFKFFLVEVVFDIVQDSVFMNDCKFKDFMEELECVKNVQVFEYVVVEFSSDEDFEKVFFSGVFEKLELAEAVFDVWWEEEMLELEVVF